ncbi:hypothetical protein LZ30DRAFT_697551 [Colletotrichum cereale]|nr:hypothetical protein LZ30DRAFT_697551 [Colletotrichum cereale]
MALHVVVVDWKVLFMPLILGLEASSVDCAKPFRGVVLIVTHVDYILVVQLCRYVRCLRNPDTGCFNNFGCRSSVHVGQPWQVVVVNISLLSSSPWFSNHSGLFPVGGAPDPAVYQPG